MKRGTLTLDRQQLEPHFQRIEDLVLGNNDSPFEQDSYFRPAVHQACCQFLYHATTGHVSHDLMDYITDEFLHGHGLPKDKRVEIVQELHRSYTAIHHSIMGPINSAVYQLGTAGETLHEVTLTEPGVRDILVLGIELQVDEYQV